MSAVSNTGPCFHKRRAPDQQSEAWFLVVLICSGILGAKHTISFFVSLSLLPWELETVLPVTFLICAFCLIFCGFVPSPPIWWMLVVMAEVQLLNLTFSTSYSRWCFPQYVLGCVSCLISANSTLR